MNGHGGDSISLADQQTPKKLLSYCDVAKLFKQPPNGITKDVLSKEETTKDIGSSAANPVASLPNNVSQNSSKFAVF